MKDKVEITPSTKFLSLSCYNCGRPLESTGDKCDCDIGDSWSKYRWININPDVRERLIRIEEKLDKILEKGESDAN